MARQTVQIFLDWDENLHGKYFGSNTIFKEYCLTFEFTEFRNVTLPQLSEKRGLGKLSARIKVQDFVALRSRLNNLREFRKQHYELQNVIVQVQPAGPDSSSIAEIKEAYERFKDTDVFNLSKDSNQIWDDAIREYEKKIYKVESEITNILRDKLATAGNANEMYDPFLAVSHICERFIFQSNS